MERTLNDHDQAIIGPIMSMEWPCLGEVQKSGSKIEESGEGTVLKGTLTFDFESNKHRSRKHCSWLPHTHCHIPIEWVFIDSEDSNTHL